ncbi:MAG TPA: outer membrane protein transport protein [Thermoanaerobaculia bacterium]|nr:outer membrane protein transport protein [Thermoanaerobaculia bacterium]
MSQQAGWVRGALVVAALVVVAAAPAGSAGFGIFEQGSQAMGMAGAFTAQADDPSAIFHNAAGLAFFTERDIMVGTTLITNTETSFRGAAPFPGPGVTADQESVVFFPSHAYYVQPINERMTFGFGFFTPFGLATEWENPDTFPGRFISYEAELQSFDLTPNIGWRLTPNFGIGIGAIARASTVELNQRAGLVNPFANFAVVDIADVSLESDWEIGYGFQLGLLHRVNSSFSWGLSYRSQVDTDYAGEADFTQISTGIPQLDAVVAASLPFGAPVAVETGIDFPDMASLGLAFALSRNTTLEVDANWTGWSSFDTLVIDFDDARDRGSELDVERREEWDDAWNYRLGFAWRRPGGSEWRLGYVFDETPQPERAAGPLLPDNDRNGFTVGYGSPRDGGMYWDVALMYLVFDEREVRESIDNFFGTYEQTAWLLGITVGWN